MIKFFFDRKSLVVKLMEISGLIFTAMLFAAGWYKKLLFINKLVFLFYLLEYLFIKACAVIHWYKDAERGEGIELQFIKAVVPTSYILALTGFLLLIGAPVALVYFSAFLLAVIAHVNVILLYLHLKDTDSSPVNYYSHNKYL